MNNSGWNGTCTSTLLGWGFWGVGFAHLAFATRLAVHGLARFNRRAARRQTVDTDLRARHRSLSYSGRGIERVGEKGWR